jgi:hypothetical protein
VQEESVKPRKGWSTKSRSLRESLRESLWGGGSVKEEVSETGSKEARRELSLKTPVSEKGAPRLGSDSDDSHIPTGQPRQVILDDAKRLREQAEEQEKNRAKLLDEKKKAESNRQPERVRSLKAKADEADKEAHKLHEKAIKRIMHGVSIIYHRHFEQTLPKLMLDNQLTIMSCRHIHQIWKVSR